MPYPSSEAGVTKLALHMLPDAYIIEVLNRREIAWPLRTDCPELHEERPIVPMSAVRSLHAIFGEKAESSSHLYLPRWRPALTAASGGLIPSGYDVHLRSAIGWALSRADEQSSTVG